MILKVKGRTENSRDIPTLAFLEKTHANRFFCEVSVDSTSDKDRAGDHLINVP